MDVPVEGSDEQIAVQQAPGYHASRSVQGCGVDGPPCVRPLAAGRICHCQGHEVCVVTTLRSPQALLWRAFSRLQLWLSWCWQLLLASVSSRSGTRLRAMHPGSVGLVPPDTRGTWHVGLRLQLLAMIPSCCPTRLKVADATVLITILAGQMAGRMD